MRPLSHLNQIALPMLVILGAQVSVNVGAAFAKSLFPLIGAEGVAALRTSIAAALLLAIWRPWRTRLKLRDFKNLAAYGAMLGLMNLLIYRAFGLIPIGVAVGIEITGPLAVVLLTSRRKSDFAWVACAILGLGLLLPLRQNAQSLHPLGVAYALGAAICWAFYIVFGKRVSSLRGGQAVSWGMLFASAITLPLGVAHAGSALLTPTTLAAGVVVALLSSALPYSLEMVALQRVSSRVFSILISAAPAIGAMAGFVILKETLTPVQWFAIGCIICACAGSSATAPQVVAIEKQEEARVS